MPEKVQFERLRAQCQGDSAACAERSKSRGRAKRAGRACERTPRDLRAGVATNASSTATVVTAAAAAMFAAVLTIVLTTLTTIVVAAVVATVVTARAGKIATST